MHLNDTKSEILKRPFYTSKSLVIDRVNTSIIKLWERTLEPKYSSGVKIEIPRRIFKYRALFGRFTREIKAACYASGTGYDAVANYIIGAMRRKVIDLADSYSEAFKLLDDNLEVGHYRQLFILLLDIGFYFFTLHPTVASSLRLSMAIVRVGQHFSEHDSEGFDITREIILRRISHLVKSPSFTNLYEKRAVIPVEFLNILVSLQQFNDDASLQAEVLKSSGLEDGFKGYFHLIVNIFIFGRQPGFEDRGNAAFDEAKRKILDSEKFYKESELVHLLLDILACPYINRSKRGQLIRDVWPILNTLSTDIGNITRVDSEQLVDEIEKQHWFVRWKDINLLNMIEKKELSAVYA